MVEGVVQIRASVEGGGMGASSASSFGEGELEESFDSIGGGQEFYFFVDEYTDDQIKEIISIFRNDFKPPKNLWIERNPSGYNSHDYYTEIFANDNSFTQLQGSNELKPSNNIDPLSPPNAKLGDT
jgi:hypothetical protein